MAAMPFPLLFVNLPTVFLMYFKNWASCLVSITIKENLNKFPGCDITISKNFKKLKLGHS